MPEQKENEPEEKFVEGRDYYFDNGLFVLTAHFLRERGYCCRNGCRHCPYGFKKDSAEPPGESNSK